MCQPEAYFQSQLGSRGLQGPKRAKIGPKGGQFSNLLHNKRFCVSDPLWGIFKCIFYIHDPRVF